MWEEKKKKRQTQSCDRERRSRNLILVEWKCASSDMVGHSCHTRDVTLCEGSVPLSLRRRARKQGFKLHHTAKLSRFSDNLKTNPSSEIYFFYSHTTTKLCCFTSCGIDKRCTARFNQWNSCRSYIFPLLVPTWRLCAWLLLCREVWWSCFLEEY